MTTKIKATNIWKKFNNLEVLKGIDLEVNEGEVVAVIGPSGGGKSTLLRCLNKLETIDKGSITIDGEELCRETSGGTEYVKNNELFKSFPVIILSSEESTSERIRLMEVGASDYIVKPFNPMELKIRIRKIIEYEYRVRSAFCRTGFRIERVFSRYCRRVFVS